MKRIIMMVLRNLPFIPMAFFNLPFISVHIGFDQSFYHLLRRLIADPAAFYRKKRTITRTASCGPCNHFYIDIRFLSSGRS